VLRWGGFAAAVLTGVSAYLGGSPLQRDLSWWIGVGVWIVGAGALVCAWLLIGRAIGWRAPRAAADPAGPTVRWLLVTAALWALPLLLAPPLGSQDAYCYACQAQLYRNGFDVYAVGPIAMPCPWLEYVPVIWQSSPVPYGPLWIAASGGAVALAGESLAGAVTALRLLAVAGTALAVVAGVHLARRCGGQPAVVAWVAALSPLVLVHDISGAHNDALLAGLVLTGLALAAGRTGTERPWLRLVLAGVAFGLAGGVKITALVAAPFAVPLVLAGAAGTSWSLVRWRRVVACCGTLGGAVLATYGVLAALTGYGIGFVHALTRTGSMVQWLSPPSGIGMSLGYLMRALGRPEAFDTAVAIPRTAALVLLVVVLVLLWRRALLRIDRIAAPVTAAGIALIATVLLGPVVYAWYAVAGLCVLATVPLPRAARIAVTAAAAGLIFLTLPDGLGLATKTKGPGAILDVILAIGALVWWWRRRRSPAAEGAGQVRTSVGQP